MEDYKTYRLGDIAEMRYGKLPPESILEGKYPVYSGYRVVGFTNTFNCKKGSIIVIARGVGGTGDVKLIKEDCFLTNLSISVVLDPAICNSAYFYYKYKMCNLRYLDSGSAQSQITIEDLKRLELKLPPISKQLRVVSVLQTLDNKIDLNKRINHNLEEQAQALYKSWFVDFEPFKDEKYKDTEIGAIPENWQTGKLSELIEICYGKDHKKLHDGSIPVYGSGGLMRFADKPIYDKESVLIPRKGTLNNVMYVDKPFWTVDTMFYSKCKTNNVIKYCHQYLLTQDLASMNAGSAVPSMTTDILNNLIVIIPPSQILAAFNCIVSSMYDEISQRNNESFVLSKTRDSLLPQLMTGEYIGC